MIRILRTIRSAVGFRSHQFSRRRITACLSALIVVAAFLCAVSFGPVSHAANSIPASTRLDQNKKRVPNFDVNLATRVVNLPSAAQLQALASLKSNLNDSKITALWDKSSGSVDAIYDFASRPSQLDPESAARAFIQSNAALFGVSDMSTLRLDKNVSAFGGNLLYSKRLIKACPSRRAESA